VKFVKTTTPGGAVAYQNRKYQIAIFGGDRPGVSLGVYDKSCRYPWQTVAQIPMHSTGYTDAVKNKTVDQFLSKALRALTDELVRKNARNVVAAQELGFVSSVTV